MNRYLSAFRTVVSHPHPVRFVVSRILLRLKLALPIVATFSVDPQVKVGLTANPIAHSAWLSDTEPKEVEVFKRYIAEQSTVFDVGSNVGTHALLAARLAHAGKVFAFEPGVSAYAALQKNVALNTVSNVTTYNAAVSTGDTRWSLVQPGLSDEQSFLVPASEGAPMLNIVRLDDVMQKHNIQQIDFLKIDVEGAELLVVRSLGERLVDVRKIFFENIPHVMERFGYTHEELYGFLIEHGFIIYTVELIDGKIALTPVESLLGASANVLAIQQK